MRQKPTVGHIIADIKRWTAFLRKSRLTLPLEAPMNLERTGPFHLPANALRHLVLLVVMAFVAWQTLGCSGNTPQRKAPTPVMTPVAEKKTDKKPEASADSTREIPQLPPSPERPPAFGGSGG